MRKGNFVFVTWIGDHTPKHVHVFRDHKLIAKWDLDNDEVLEGAITARIKGLITELKKEGRL